MEKSFSESSTDPPSGPMGTTAPGGSRKRTSNPSPHQRTGSFSATELSAIHEELKMVTERIARLREELEHGVDEGTLQNTSFHDFTIPSPSVVRNSRVVASVRDGELCRLAAEGNVRGVKMILSEQHDINCHDYDGRTPLHLAALNGFSDVVRLLLDFGANSSLEDADGKTAADLALEANHSDVLGHFMTSVGDAEPESFNLSPSSFNPDKGRTAAAAQKTSSAFNAMSPLGVALSRDFKLGTGLVLIMVGLPGRGKSYIAQRIRRYFLWFGFDCEILSHARYRKALNPKRGAGANDGVSPGQPHTPPEQLGGDAGSGDRASGAGSSSLTAKEASIEVTVAQCIAAEIQAQFASRVGSVAIVDGTNSTIKRRNCLAQEILKTGCVKIGQDLIFVEIHNDDAELIRGNVLRAKELQGAAAVPNFVEAYYENMREHERVYVPLEPEREGRHHSFIRVVNERTLHLNKISGIVPSRLAYLLHNLKHSPVPLYLTLPGEHEDLITSKLGGNGRLTERGRAYSLALYNFMARERLSKLAVLAGSKKRCIHSCYYFSQAAQQLIGGGGPNDEGPGGIDCTVDSFPTLDDISYGDCEGQTLEEVRATLPNTLDNLTREPYTTAWPNGESIQQVYMSRLEPHIHDIQASPHPVLVVSHTCIVQGLLTYFDDSSKYRNPEEATEVLVPRHTVLRLEHRGAGRCVEPFDLSADVDAILARWTEERRVRAAAAA